MSSSACTTAGRGVLVFLVAEDLPVDNLRVFRALRTGERAMVELFELLEFCVTFVAAAVAVEEAGRSSTF